MKLKEKIIASGLIVFGMLICSMNYFIIKFISNIGAWLAEALNAPTGIGIGIGITILCLVPLFGVLFVIGIIGGFFIVLGLRYFKY